MDASQLFELHDHHLAMRGLSEATRTLYRWHLNAFADRLRSTTPTAGRHDLELYLLDRRKQQGWSPGTVACAVRALRSFYAWAADDGFVTANAAEKLRTPKQPETPVTTASAADLRALLATCSSSSFVDVRDGAILRVLARTGMRHGELCALRVDDVDFKERRILVRSSKAGRPRRVPFDPATFAQLAAYLPVRQRQIVNPTVDPGDALWITDAPAPLQPQGLRRMIARRAARAGVNVTAHSFRRGLAVEWLRAGGSTASLQRIAGWSSPNMVARYTGVAEELAVAEYERIFG